jgi:hypothetical protein
MLARHCSAQVGSARLIQRWPDLRLIAAARYAAGVLNMRFLGSYAEYVRCLFALRLLFHSNLTTGCSSAQPVAQNAGVENELIVVLGVMPAGTLFI